MAVDVKTLTIGSHILVDGKRERVRGIRPVRSPFNVFQVIIQHEAKIFSSLGYVPSTSNTIEPIPITPDLLKELGFVRKPNADKKRYFDFLWEREDVESDDTCWEHSEKDNFFLLHSGAFGQLNVKYLHEAEAFLGLHNIELIEDEYDGKSVFYILDNSGIRFILGGAVGKDDK